jgi:HK97 family phage portal protein
VSIRTRFADFVIKTLDPKRAPIGTQLSFGSDGGTSNYASAYGSNGWVYACSSRIAQAVGEAEPHMYRRKNDDVEEVFSHPLLDVLAHMTDFHTRQEAFELEETYLDLMGEWAMLIFRNGFGIKELWPINPRQLSVVPHPTEYISGYVFNSNDGKTKVPLEKRDVLFIKTPNPNSLYRGQGAIQAIATDIDADRYASLWNKNFFINGASHGGAIEVPKELTPDAYERLVAQWKQGHQGVANAHRIAILQGGAKWVPPASALKDMDFPNLRRANRDIVLGAFGMSPHMLGAEETTNRSTAESSEFVFDRWVVLPRLRRIAGKINEFLLPQFPKSEDMWLEFDDPTPENQEFDLQLAKDGFAAGFLTRNEARELVGMDNLGPTGDIFFMGIMVQPQKIDEEVTAFSPTASPSDAGDAQDDEGKASVTAPDATQDTAENIASGEKLSGVQIQAAMAVINQLIAGAIPAGVALELLVAVGIDRERAQSMITAASNFTPDVIVEPKGKGLTPEVRWDAFVKRLTPMENKFGGWVKGEFVRQRRETLSKVKKSVKVLGEVYEAGKYARDISKGANPYLRAMISVAGEAGAAELGTMFSMSNPRVLEYLGTRTAKFGIYVTDTISKDITRELQAAYNAGESIPQIAARIENVFDAAENRATMIARTEMVACSNEGALESYRQSGVVQQKQWLAALDERTRESHMMANGDIVDLEDDFKVGYSSGPCPGSIGDPAEDCNCRCSVAPVVRPDSPLHEVH